MKIEQSEIIETNDYRVIIYPASRPFTAKESKDIAEKLFEYLSTWRAHGKPLSSSFKIEHNQFIIVVVDEDKEMASGCSIDALNSVLRELDTTYSLGLFDRMKASYMIGENIITKPLAEFRKEVRSGEISEDAQVFDFSKSTYVNYLSDFLLPLRRSWAGIYVSN
ncbi:hypothetical protein [Planobacterium oryzisoli]|uniref:ABC transporter ATPase n=1 Tax=Planobacterium oryzisoli TaxID=2771435 RepID=A0A930YWR8_9FLAO|nr:hypothetical protein [Planobacterium oryzisoli]MBF5027854.1 hypothetical protein [Planobacterium oryzisoli]